jgi:hypothetical protein
MVNAQDPHINYAPRDFDPNKHLPPGLHDFIA